MEDCCCWHFPAINRVVLLKSLSAQPKVRTALTPLRTPGHSFHLHYAFFLEGSESVVVSWFPVLCRVLLKKLRRSYCSGFGQG
jgi:hypothetical protein